MFEITADDIALLNDEDLRALVGLLCEAEARSRGFSASSVTWGGNQNAADGGLDVRVALPDRAGIGGFVPRPTTGFQVKTSDMPRAEILDEMRPDGTLRSVICDLARRSGAYIIVSSKGSTSDVSLQNRREAMAEAVKDLPNANAVTLDFYDRTRLATWVRDHAGLIPWVREKIGKAIHGWHSYGAWAFAPEGASGEYLLDDKVRIRTDTEVTEDGLQALEGIRRIRDRLRNPRGVVRLVGLSGVGKTRLVQALFDDRVGQQSLNPSLATYTNMADEPDPQPTAVASHLIATRTSAILVIDNCPADLHRRLSELCRRLESLVSVITVEYDIREDQPEGTEVFELEPSSIDLIEKLVKHRFPQLSPVDARTIAEFSGGNARIAIALSETVDKHETVAGLSDEDLFKRLFQQRHEPNESLLLAAQVLSLVYSFQGEDVSDSDQAELFRFAALTGKNTQEMFQSAAELRRRNLIQARGVWRAVLPQAIANRLAAGALQNIPSATIEARLIKGAPERLIRSFSRRLGYLDSSQEARTIVRRWLGTGGWLEKVAELDDLGRAILNNIAPVEPEAVLSAFERALLESKSDHVVQKCRRYAPLLRSIAYDAARFERCVALILKIAEAGDIDDDANEVRKVFASLFPIYFSGTHATIEERLAVTKSLLLSDDPKKRTLGLTALRVALEASHFGPGYNFEFGARSRDYGYWPRTRDDVKHWFQQTLKLAEAFALSEEPVAPRVRNILAGQFRGLWSGAGMYDDLEHVSCAIAKKHFWTEGWTAVRQTIHYDSKGFSPEISARLAALEALLRPRDLVQKVRSMVLSEAVTYVGLDSTDDATNDIAKTTARAEAMARDLGKAVAVDHDAFAELLPELTASNSQQLWSFGGGLAQATEEPGAIWSQLTTHLAATPTEKRSPQVFRGFLNALHAIDSKLANALLDNALEDEALAQWYPVLQTAVGIDKEGVNRLLRSLELGKASIGIYRNLVAGGVTHQICGRDFNRLLLRIAREPGGLDIAIEILYMRLSFDRTQSSDCEIVDVGCELMRQLRFTNRSNDVTNHRLGMIARHCLIEDKGAATVREVCRNLKEAVSESETYAFYHGDLLGVLLGTQPGATLEALCGGDTQELKLGFSILEQAGQLRSNPFDAIPESDLLKWCDQQPEIRYPAVASGVTPFQWSGEAERLEWANIARKLLDRAPNRIEVLKKFVNRFGPVTWAGSHATIVESNAKLLDDLATYPDPAVIEFIRAEKIRLADAIKDERHTETLMERERDERFE